jgi:hypothetical protein
MNALKMEREIIHNLWEDKEFVIKDINIED